MQHITTKFKTKTTCAKVIKKKLDILAFLYKQDRHPSIHSKVKKEKMLAYAMKNYTNPLLPCFDFAFTKKINQYQTARDMRRNKNLEEKLVKAEQHIVSEGWRPSFIEAGVGYGEIRLTPSAFYSSLFNHMTLQQQERLARIMKAPTKVNKRISDRRAYFKVVDQQVELFLKQYRQAPFYVASLEEKFAISLRNRLREQKG